MIIRNPIACFAGRTRDASVLALSSSGGVFTELARMVFKDGGVVIGAKWLRDAKGLRVVHAVAKNESELAQLRGSKYVVSDMSAILPAMKECLAFGRKVMFTGTPCQTAAVRKVFGENDKLILVSLICHANVSFNVWNAWVREVERKAHSRLVSVSMRDKRVGTWVKPKLVMEFENPSKNISPDLYATPYGLAFTGLGVRDCCSKCPFRCGHSGADIQIGDLWGVENVSPQYDDGKGVSAILLYTERGKTLFDRLALDSTPLTYEQILQGNPRLEHSPTADPIRRERFFKYLKTHTFSRALRIAEIGRKAELKEFYYLSHPRLVNSLPMRTLRLVRRLANSVGKSKSSKE